jgi:hypothetical protein
LRETPLKGLAKNKTKQRKIRNAFRKLAS